MSLFRRAKEITGGLADTSKRQAQRGKIELDIRRLEGRINDEKQALGDVLYPLLESGSLTSDAPGVATHVEAIKSLLQEVEGKRAEADALRDSTSAPDDAPGSDTPAGEDTHTAG